jgi:SAM-dependent methyltransferase
MSKTNPLSDQEYAECFDAFKKVSTEWSAIEEWLSHEFLPFVEGREGADVLSIGSGTGDFDLNLMKMLLGKIPHIRYVAMDPNQNHNREFFSRYEKSGLKLDFFEIMPQPFGHDNLEGSFDLIHMTHCLYYIPDREKAIIKAYDLLKPHGILLIFHQTALGINEIQRAYMKQVKGHEKEMFSAYDILQIFKKLGLKFNFEILVSDIDVTDCMEENESGDRILSFFLESDLNGIEPYLKKEIINTLKETCRVHEGKYQLFHPTGIFWIRK